MKWSVSSLIYWIRVKFCWEKKIYFLFFKAQTLYYTDLVCATTKALSPTGTVSIEIDGIQYDGLVLFSDL